MSRIDNDGRGVEVALAAGEQPRFDRVVATVPTGAIAELCLIRQIGG